MVTIVKHYEHNRIEAHGLSTDEKPMTVLGYPIANASFFYEMDTGKVFEYDEENGRWLEQKLSGD